MEADTAARWASGYYDKKDDAAVSGDYDKKDDAAAVSGDYDKKDDGAAALSSKDCGVAFAAAQGFVEEEIESLGVAPAAAQEVGEEDESPGVAPAAAQESVVEAVHGLSMSAEPIVQEVGIVDSGVAPAAAQKLFPSIQSNFVQRGGSSLGGACVLGPLAPLLATMEEQAGRLSVLEHEVYLLRTMMDEERKKKRKERKKQQKVKLAEDVKVAAEEAVQVLMDSKQ